jgi:hypothetical protein
MLIDGCDMRWRRTTGWFVLIMYKLQGRFFQGTRAECSIFVNSVSFGIRQEQGHVVPFPMLAGCSRKPWTIYNNWSSL